jgi:hypothetical protein
MKKPVIHLGDAPYGDGPCRLGSEVLCGKIAGSTHGVVSTKSYAWLGGWNLELEELMPYSVYLTRLGIEACSLDFRDVAKESIKMHGYYNSYRYGNTFTICEECLGSEDFGLLVLASV